MIVLDLPRGFDKVVTSCNILIPCNMTYGSLRSVSLALTVATYPAYYCPISKKLQYC